MVTQFHFITEEDDINSKKHPHTELFYSLNFPVDLKINECIYIDTFKKFLTNGNFNDTYLKELPHKEQLPIDFWETDGKVVDIIYELNQDMVVKTVQLIPV